MFLSNLLAVREILSQILNGSECLDVIEAKKYFEVFFLF